MFTEKNEIIEQYINYLSDKGKITKIKDINKNIALKFSNGFTGYFLLAASIAFSILTVYLIIGKDTLSGYDPVSKFIIITGLALFSLIIILVTKNEVNKTKLVVKYLNDSEIKINNKIYNIHKDECYINILRNFETWYSGSRLQSRRHVIMYYLILVKNNKKKTFIITPEIEELLVEFIYNFDFEFSKDKMKYQKKIDEYDNRYIEYYKKQNK